MVQLHGNFLEHVSYLEKKEVKGKFKSTNRFQDFCPSYITLLNGSLGQRPKIHMPIDTESDQANPVSVPR